MGLQRNRFKVIVFERQDRLARMISEAKHNMLMDYVCTTEKCVDEHGKKKVRLKPEHLKEKLRDDEIIGNSTIGWLKDHGFDDSQITFLNYRDLVKDPKGQVGQLYTFLGAAD